MASGSYVFKNATNTSEYARIDSSGRLGVGTTSFQTQSPAGSISFPQNASIQTGSFGRLWNPAQQIGQAGAAGLYGMALTYLAYYDSGWKSLGGGTATAVTLDEGRFSVASSNGVGAGGSALTWTTTLSVVGGGTLALQGATSNTGIGITFPAAQSASSDANTLDDYEEGTWTPTLVSTGATFTYTAATGGTYVKIGRLVLLSGVISLASKSGGSTGNSVGFGNLPFNAGAPDSSGSGQGLVFTAGIGGLTVSADYGTPNGAVCTPNTSTAYPLLTAKNGGNAITITYDKLDSTSYAQFSMTYYASA